MSSSEEDNENMCRPTTPNEADCCGNGCDPCILDVHKRLLEQWKTNKLAGVHERHKRNLLNLVEYKKFIVTGIETASADSIFIRLKYKGNIEHSAQLFLNPGQHVILHTPTLSRPFTPILWTHNNLLLLVKLYAKGSFSNYAKQLKIDDQIDIRGPYGDFLYKSNSYEQILMFSIGSGIASLYPIAKSIIIDNDEEETKIHLIAGFRSLAHVPLKKELRALADYWNFKCTLQISQDDGDITLNGLKMEHGRLKEGIVRELLKYHSLQTTLILICGTPEFNDGLEKIIRDTRYLHYHIFK
ncbi:NADH-cytochrome b5 reductase-like [Cephus cinctus]|uniref:NADH-cytochrome b5 reductase-like n=1 Tax=Cephus cinctus TaxID=211228 RepID=A0AAJ7BL61_CEPCN|nr:NADH-cytochrome b5 reductase-like [Cephus cinctus]